VVGPHGCPRGRGGHLYPGPTGPVAHIGAPCIRTVRQAAWLSTGWCRGRGEDDDITPTSLTYGSDMAVMCRQYDLDIALISNWNDMGLIWA